MNKKDTMNYNIIVITQSFPYLPGEQFLETEVKYYRNLNVMIMPLNKSDKVRSVGSNIQIDNYLVDKSTITKKEKIPFAINALFSSFFLKELIKYNLFNIGRLKRFLGSVAMYQKYFDLFDRYFSNKSELENTVVYTYWNNEATYALQSLKKKYGYKLISRIHGYDLYQERQIANYMPLKSQFTNNIDRLFTITESANEYLHKTYGFDYDTLELSRLGVDDLGNLTLPSGQNTLHIVSCSFLTQVKRVDKIIDALAIASDKMPNTKYIWTHLGGGKLQTALLSYAKIKLNNLDNVQFDIKGTLGNQEIFDFYKTNNIDLFINTSESEGVPVSIMEAMSCHIPIIAPNIGGISDMVSSGVNGYLLSSRCEIDEIVDALCNIGFFKNESIRYNSYNVFLNKYSAKINYDLFLKKLGIINSYEHIR